LGDDGNLTAKVSHGNFADVDAVDADVAAAAAVDAQKDWPEKLAQQTKQSQNLLTSVVVMIAIVGSWLIWADVIPALRVVYQQNLWTIVETVSTANGTNTGVAPITKEVVRAITPTDLLQALLVLLMTFVIFRNLPGLIDILVLNQLPIDASYRNAIAAVLSYLVIVIGTIWSARCIGVYWTS
jgi:potassium efflux system protein